MPRVVLSGRGRECAMKIGTAVSIAEPKVLFVPGYLSGGTPVDGAVACGPGTLYPLAVTLAQMEEIFYRVRDAWFTSGTVEATGHSSAILGEPASDLFNSEEGASSYTASRRAYCIKDSATIIDGRWDTPYTISTTAADFDGNLADGNYIDASSELAMWEAESPICAFQHTISSGNDHATGYRFITVGQPFCYLNLQFSRTVAWIGGDTPYTASSLYVSLQLLMYNFSGFYASTYSAALGNPLLSTSLEIVLSTSVVSCPIYIDDYGGSYEVPTLTTFTLTSKQWWPYATSSGATAWSPTNGSPTNGGPGA